MKTACELDHLVLGAQTLEHGAAYIAELLGVDLQPGGKHAAMGTHNLLLRLGARTYLEVISIDPAAQTPQRPRWFGLDSAAVRDRLRERPRLLTWAARTGDIDAACKASQIPLGRIESMSRGSFSWRISIPPDGALLEEGLIPALIQWDGDTHPADGLADRGCTLVELEGRHPAPALIAHALDALGLKTAMALAHGAARQLTATIRTPRRTVVFD
jgi:hypothetical protein